MRATRHSARVRFLRKAVPLGVLFSFAAIVLVSVFNPFRLLGKLPLQIGNLVVSGTKITMESPHLAGFTSDQRPYELWATTATQDLTAPDVLDLTKLRAKVLTEDRSQVTLESRTGVFNTKAQLLDLHQDIFLQSSSGYEARMSRAQVDLGKGTVASDEPVNIKLLNGTLDANRMRIVEGGAIMYFDKGVTMLVQPDQPATPPPAEPAAPAPAAKDIVQPAAKKK